MTEQKETLLKRSSKVYQNLSIQRMELREFAELAEICTNPIIIASRTFNTVETSFTLENSSYYFIQKDVIASVNIMDEYCSKFHDSIEFSTYLPLTVVPFLLPLLTILKKAMIQVTCIKQFLKKTRLQPKEYREITKEINILKAICDELVIQTQFLLQKARFQEKSLKRVS